VSSKLFGLRAKARGAGVATDHRVRLLGAPLRPPATLAEREALALLTREGSMALGRLVDLVARDLYRDELRHGGGGAEIGLIGSTLFRSDAWQAVEAADSVLWTIEPSTSSTSDPPSP
jgi:hypothetical protein